MAASIYTDFAEQILQVAPLFSIGGITSWQVYNPNAESMTSNSRTFTLQGTITLSIFRPTAFDKALGSLPLIPVFNADWIGLGAYNITLLPEAVLVGNGGYYFRVIGTVAKDIHMAIAPLAIATNPLAP